MLSFKLGKNLSWFLIGISIAAILGMQYLGKVTPGMIPFFAIITFLASIFIIVKSSDYTVYSMEDYSKKTKLPHFLVGFVILSIVTVFPDLFTGIFVSQAGHGEMILGDILTATLIDVVLLIGITAFIIKKVPINEPELKGSTPWLILGLMVLPLLMFIDGKLNQVEAILLLIGFASYLVFMTRRELKVSHIVKSIAFRSIWKDIFIFGINLGALILGARWMTLSAGIIAENFGISPFIIGFIFIAFGNSIAEIVFTTQMARKGESDMSLGNSFGSVLVNILVVWGVAALVRPLEVSKMFIYSYIALLVVMVGVIWLVQKNNYLTRKHGIILLVVYLLFTVINVIVNY